MIFKERYEMKDKIGRGGYGEVFKVLDKKDGDSAEALAETAKDLCDDEFVEVGEKKYIDFNKDSEV